MWWPRRSRSATARGRPTAGRCSSARSPAAHAGVWRARSTGGDPAARPAPRSAGPSAPRRAARSRSGRNPRAAAPLWRASEEIGAPRPSRPEIGTAVRRSSSLRRSPSAACGNMTARTSCSSSRSASRHGRDRSIKVKSPGARAASRSPCANTVWPRTCTSILNSSGSETRMSLAVRTAVIGGAVTFVTWTVPTGPVRIWARSFAVGVEVQAERDDRVGHHVLEIVEPGSRRLVVDAYHDTHYQPPATRRSTAGAHWPQAHARIPLPGPPPAASSEHSARLSPTTRRLSRRALQRARQRLAWIFRCSSARMPA